MDFGLVRESMITSTWIINVVILRVTQPNPRRNKNKSRRRKKPGGGQSVFKKHHNQPFHERDKKLEEIGEPLPYTEIEGPLIPVLKSGNIEQARASLSTPFHEG